MRLRGACVSGESPGSSCNCLEQRLTRLGLTRRGTTGIEPAEEPGASDVHSAVNNAMVPPVFIIGPDKRIKLTLTYAVTMGRNFDQILRVRDSM